MKEKILQGYIQRQMKNHAWKKNPLHRRAIVTGVTDRPGEVNVGSASVEELSETFTEVRIATHDDFDFTKIKDCKRLVDLNKDCDTLIICHGKMNLDWVEDLDTDMIEEMISTNLTSIIHLVSNFAKATMHEDYRKTIIIIGSMSANSVMNGSAHYCAAKSGVEQFVKCASWELTPKGFDVYVINPCNIELTPMSAAVITSLAEFRGISIPEAEAYWGGQTTRNEFLSPYEIGELVSELASGKFKYMSGRGINLAGGQR